jgi:hypothetical protein
VKTATVSQDDIVERPRRRQRPWPAALDALDNQSPTNPEVSGAVAAYMRGQFPAQVPNSAQRSKRLISVRFQRRSTVVNSTDFILKALLASKLAGGRECRAPSRIEAAESHPPILSDLR